MATTAWQRSLQDSIVRVEQLTKRFDFNPRSLGEVEARYPLRITPYYASLIKQVGDPIWKQCVPDVRELSGGGMIDPLAEEDNSPVPTIIHRYPDRVIFYVAGNCASYCRFCTRKRKVGCSDSAVSFRGLRDGIEYIAANPHIRDVIFSGGDPLLLPDSVLKDLLQRVHAIPHVEIIRIGSRVPVTLPERITPQLCAILKQFGPLYLNTHFNHPWELTFDANVACSKLIDAGIVLGNQTVLLRGVNDKPAIIAELFRGLLKMRIRPYYLHQMDLTQGTEHFRTQVSCGLQIMDSLRGAVSGLAIPNYVIDLPGGKGKVELLPRYIKKNGDNLLIQARDGSVVEYPELPAKRDCK